MSTPACLFVVACAFVLTASAAIAEPPGPCGQLVVAAAGEAIAPTDRKKDGPLNHTYPLSNGSGPSGDLVNVVWGDPRFGAYSTESLNSSCSLIGPQSASDAWTAHLNVQITRSMGSGLGKTAGAGGEISADWFMLRTLPQLTPDNGWKLSAIGTIDANNASPKCSIQVNDSTQDLPAGPVFKFYNNLRGQVGILFRCAQEHTSIFSPADGSPTPRTTRGTVTYDVTFTYQQQ